LNARIETVDCPYCGSRKFTFWAEEAGFNCVRCDDCRILYCNPRPTAAAVDSAVRTGAHGEEAGGLVVVSRRIGRKVQFYRGILAEVFADVWKRGKPISWIDVGAGYGEFVEAVSLLAPPGSDVMGFEPMKPKADSARARGLKVTNDYLRSDQPKVDFVSSIDVFSHIPDYAAFLGEIRGVLKPGGEVFIETGNLADVEDRGEFPGELGLPDHLVFAGEKHMRGYLERLGFEVVSVRSRRIDGLVNLCKNAVKLLIGRPAALGIPYRSKYRQLQLRARLRPAQA
jgi:SAM-dependent methyltransferase